LAIFPPFPALPGRNETLHCNNLAAVQHQIQAGVRREAR
jgi:hypothetical protein